MRTITTAVATLILLVAGLLGQQTPTSPSAVPRLVRIANIFRPANSQSSAPVESVTFSIYKDEQGGTPLWSETQNVSVDSEGHYAALLGSTLPDGVPADLFSTAAPRWLGVQFNRPGEVEQHRVLLVSVPYALKAADADTLGGRPASAYLLNPAAVTTATADSTTPTLAAGASAPASFSRANPVKPHLFTSSMNYLPFYYDTSNDLANSVLYQNAGMLGLATTTPLDYFHVRFVNTNGAFTGYAVQNLGNTSTSYSGMLFFDQNGALGQFQGFNNGTHEYRINNIASGGSINFMLGSSSKFFVGSGGIGIGKTTPGYPLDVAGDINLSGGLRFQGNTLLGFPVYSIGGNYSGSIALGQSALANTTLGESNTAVGLAALQFDTSGSYNVAVGNSALNNTTTAYFNTAIGSGALEYATAGGNTAVGANAGSNLAGGSNNIYIGQDSGPSTFGTSESFVIRIGGSQASGYAQTATFIAGIRAATTGQNNAVPVVIDSNGQLGTLSSSRRYKEDIHDMGEASSGLMRLRPVTFRYKKPFADGSKPIQYGLIAEEVAGVYPDLVARGADGQIETVKYQLLPTMLLNEVQRQERTIVEQQRLITDQQREIDILKIKLNGLLSLESRLAALESASPGNR